MGLFFNIRKPRKFEHKPIYFDPDKEALQQRVERIKQELGMAEKSDYRNQIKGSFFEQTKHVKPRDTIPGKSHSDRNIKLIVALVCLILLFCFLYTGIQLLF